MFEKIIKKLLINSSSTGFHVGFNYGRYSGIGFVLAEMLRKSAGSRAMVKEIIEKMENIDCQLFDTEDLDTLQRNGFFTVTNTERNKGE
jgi:hypothetical protein